MNPAERNRRRLEWLRQYVFDPVYWSRGEDLVQRGRVRSCEFSADERRWHIAGRVQGTQRAPYAQNIDISWRGEDDVKPSSIECSCTCPIGEACKHCAALLIEFGERLLEQETAEAETLDTLGSGDVAPPPEEEGRIPLGELVELMLGNRPLAPGKGGVSAVAERAAEILEAKRSPAMRWIEETARLRFHRHEPHPHPGPDQQPPERILYDVRLDERRGVFGWNAFLTRPYKRDPRRFVAGKPVDLLTIYYHPEVYGALTVADLMGLAVASMHGPPRTWLGAAFAAIVQSGRACLGSHTEGVFLRWGEPRRLLWLWRETARGAFQGVWHVEGNGDAGIVPLRFMQPWHYFQRKTHTVGPLLLPEGLDWGDVERLDALPPVPQEDAPVFARRWSELFGQALPAPAPVATTRVEEPARFRLILWRDEQGRRRVRPEVRYGEVAVDAQGRVHHPFGDEVRLELPHRSVAREKQWFGTVRVLLEPLRMALVWPDFAEYEAQAESPLLWHELRERLESGVLDEFSPEIEVADDFWPQQWEASTADVELAQADEGGDWFAFDAKVKAGEREIDLTELAAEVFERYGEDDWPEKIVYPFPEEDACAVVPLEPIAPILKLTLELLRREPRREGPVRLSRYDFSLLRELPPGTLAQIQAPTLSAMLEELERHGGPMPVEEPPGLQAQMRPYQRTGLAWLQFWRRHRLHGILADDMGLGKTLQALAHLLTEKAAGRLTQPALVVAPTSLVGNWAREAARFTPDLRVLVWHGAQRRERLEAIPGHDLVITTYPLVWRDVELLRPQAWSVMILDEAQMIKNPRAQVSQHVRKFRAEQRLCLTGTPMENHLGELWAIFDFLMPGFLGSLETFNRWYRHPIEQEGDAARLEHLRRRIRPFLLRRTKAEVVAELPPKTEIVQTVTLGEKQAKVYEAIRLTMQERVRRALAEKGLARSQITVLDALLKLRQVCCDPTLVDLPQARQVKESAKLDWLRETLPELVEEGRRILVFSQFVQMLERIEPVLAELKIPYVKLTGSTRRRDEVIDRFRRGDAPVFLISLKAGGVGLNLTEADTVILFDPWWNPAVEEQAIDRTHRIGQDKPVFVYKLIAANTVEEKMLEMQARKRSLAEGTLETGEAGGFALTEEDVAALLSSSPLEV